MFKHIGVFLFLGVWLAVGFAADSYTIDPLSSLAHFQIMRVGFTTQSGRFNKTSGNLTMDLAARSGSVSFTIDSASIDMNSESWNTHLGDEGLLNVAKFPAMNFKSDRLIFEGDSVVAADGKFTMLGITKPVQVTVKNFQCGLNAMDKRSICSGDISASLKRSEYGLTKYIPAVSDEVNIGVRVDAYKN